MLLRGRILRTTRGVAAHIGQRARVFRYHRSCFQDFGLRHTTADAFARFSHCVHALLESNVVDQCRNTRSTVRIRNADEIGSLETDFGNAIQGPVSSTRLPEQQLLPSQKPRLQLPGQNGRTNPVRRSLHDGQCRSFRLRGSEKITAIIKPSGAASMVLEAYLGFLGYHIQTFEVRKFIQRLHWILQ